jgi:hypothetical protein
MEEQNQSFKMTEEEKYNFAKKRVKEIRDYYVTLAIYIIVNLTLFLIWYFRGKGYPWFFWPLGGWGIAIILHTLRLFVFGKGDWEQRKIKEITDKME